MSKPQLYRIVKRGPIESEPNEVKRYVFERWTDDNWLWTVGQVSRWTGVSKRATRRAFAQLEADGYIRRYG